MESTRGNEDRKESEAMMTRIHKATAGRMTADPRINLMGERVDRVWEDPILTPRNGIAR